MNIILKIILILFSFAHFNSAFADNDLLKKYILELDTKDFKKKISVIEKISEVDTDYSLHALKSILNGKLFIRKSDQKILLVDIINRKYNTFYFFTNEEAGIEKKRKLKKIKINNNIRNKLNNNISILQLSRGTDVEKIKAIFEIIKEGNQQTLQIINYRIKKEKKKDILKSLEIAKNSIIARYGANSERIDAIKNLSGKTNIDLVNILKNISEDKSLQKNIVFEANKALNISLKNIKYNNIMKTIFFGLSLGSVLLLAAIGLAITFGVVGVINMAHGELIMLGAYCTYVVQQIIPNDTSLSIIIAVPVAFIFTGIVGILIERLIVKNLYGRPLETLLATFGLSLILQQLVRSIFSPLNKTVYSPEWMSGVSVIGGLELTNNRLVIIIFTLIVFLLVIYVLRKTVFGLHMRAVTQNRKMASAMGINTKKIDMLTFAFGSGVAGVAGVALSQITNVGPNLGQNYIIDSFMVVVFGGVGNLLGTFIGAFGLGVGNKLIEPYTGAILSKILILLFIIIFIQFRPRGIFSLKGRTVDD
ncbi:urea ABC transporter permease subunit UrtB [Alphaproteobacteria bacterium]|nr:urea ABC transporter permease subunit UrtB [Alphaproteobacteria bacterium]